MNCLQLAAHDLLKIIDRAHIEIPLDERSLFEYDDWSWNFHLKYELSKQTSTLLIRSPLHV